MENDFKENRADDIQTIILDAETIENKSCKSDMRTFHGFGFYNWLAVGWAYYWRNIVVSSIMWLCVAVIIFAAGAVLYIAAPETLGDIRLLLLALFGAVLSVWGGVIANCKLLDWMLKIRYNGYRIALIENKEENEVEFASLKIGERGVFGWSLLWRNFILLVGVFFCVVALEFLIGTILGSLGFDGMFLQVIPGTDLTYLQIFNQSWGYYIAFLSSMLLCKWFFGISHSKYRFAVVEIDKSKQPEKIRHGLLSWLLFSIIVGCLMTALMYIFLEKIVIVTSVDYSLMKYLDYLQYITLSVCLLEVIAAVSIWNWKKWGLYLYILVNVFHVLVTLIFMSISILFIVPYLVSMIAVIYLVKKQWDEFS